MWDLFFNAESHVPHLNTALALGANINETSLEFPNLKHIANTFNELQTCNDKLTQS